MDTSKDFLGRRRPDELRRLRASSSAGSRTLRGSPRGKKHAPHRVRVTRSRLTAAGTTRTTTATAPSTTAPRICSAPSWTLRPISTLRVPPDGGGPRPECHRVRHRDGQLLPHQPFRPRVSPSTTSVTSKGAVRPSSSIESGRPRTTVATMRPSRTSSRSTSSTRRPPTSPARRAQRFSGTPIGVPRP